ncbi:hypothetical protein FIV42_09725 [Persicimonas caeni]|uniref:Lipoprotein n=1 Tax=Persicimonas caeni TaxID=2292766 RepID=A0A4Y6PRN3_PERCE|nr:hypothetical protein [Persicimonas caeni]QDG51004.1 hypothetical protein FIV42_09725 [Persicimonas caeni]QED32225.1 hypothetical protein FRD00_09720 [Persicimonas caeni]
MKRRTKWTILFSALLALSACSKDAGEDMEVECERIDVGGTAYCTYEQPITETGYDCPQDLPHAVDFQGHTVCSPTESIPDEDRGPLEEHFAQGSGEPVDGGTDGGGETTLSQLCTTPQAYDGQTVTLDGSQIETINVGTTRGCPDTGEGCCNAVVTGFVLACGQNQVGNVDRDTAIVLVAGDDAGFEFVQGEVVTDEVADLEGLVKGEIRMGCVGQECYEVCGPAAPEEIISFTGTFRSSGGPFYPTTRGGLGDPPGIFDYAVEVTNMEVAE